jgi:hypothetical protein
VAHVDQAMSLLTGVPAGEAGAGGQYPADSINRRVATRVAELGALRKGFAKPPEETKQKNRRK